MDLQVPLHGLVRYPQLHDRQWLIDRYVIQKRSMRAIADELGCAHGTVVSAIRRQRIDRETYVRPEYGHQFYRCPHCAGTGRLKR